MRLIGACKGVDIDLYSIDVLVETVEEQSMSPDDFRAALAPVLAAEGIDPDEVLFVHRYAINEHGNRVEV